MKTTFCKCGNRLFFNNHTCLACGRAVGRCQTCRKLTSFTAVDEQADRQPSDATPSIAPQATVQLASCDQPGCGERVAPCTNRLQGACTNFVSGDTTALCEWCNYTSLIPDIDQAPNLSRWIALEAAKRRLLAELEQLGLPPYISGIQSQFPLTFKFAAPTMVDGVAQPVITGHLNGEITINAEEADSDRREATRVALGEPQRTLIGHMRHEIGHYIDWSYASRIDNKAYRALFGDPQAIDYEQAKQRHYATGAPQGWSTQFVSAYASMHPWEDFAETVNAYLDLMAIADTARDQKLGDIDTSPSADMSRIIQLTLPVAVAISEFNTDLGLQPLLPEQLSPVAVSKLSYVHSLRHPDQIAKLTQLSNSAENENADAAPKPPQAGQLKPLTPARAR